jgi:magnesium-transporting ATPase (P-type)
MHQLNPCQVPADCRVLEASNLKVTLFCFIRNPRVTIQPAWSFPTPQVDNSSLTGETEPLRRVPDQTNDSPFETKNLAFYGTFFTEGSGKVVVYATGDRTFLGTIAASTMNTETRQSTLNVEIHYFIKIMSVIAIALGVVFFIIAVVVVEYPILEVKSTDPLHRPSNHNQLSSLCTGADIRHRHHCCECS